MKRLLFGILAFSVLGLSSCVKTSGPSGGCEDAPAASEDAAMVKYFTDNGITGYQKDPNGFYYKIVNPGTGVNPNQLSTVEVTYTGKLMNNTVFDQTSGGRPAVFNLSQVIVGWQLAIPLIKEGGKIQMVLPSIMAYGCAGAGGSIPPNSPLFFEVNLIDVK